MEPRAALALVADSSLPGRREPDALIARPRQPLMIVSDNATRHTSRAVLD